MPISNLELHGIAAPLDQEIALQAGEFKAIFEPARGYLRRIRKDGGRDEVLVVYLHVRDKAWNTPMPKVTMLQTEVEADAFTVKWHAVSQEEGVDFEWTGTLTGTAEGEITYHCLGHANIDMETNRTGLCLLIPRTFQQSELRVTHPDGTTEQAAFPYKIVTDHRFTNIQGLHYGQTDLTFSGDKFEIEDQRNWTDASYKVYPLCGDLPKPYLLKKGQVVEHQVTFRPYQTGGPKILAAPSPDSTANLPRLGTTLANDSTDLAWLAGSGFEFVRVELPADTARWATSLAHARSAGLPLHVVAFLNAQQVAVAAKLLGEAPERLTVFSPNGGPAGEACLTAMRDAGYKCGTGATFFSSFNEAGPIKGNPAFIEFGAMPQIHTFDERSILENATTLEDNVRSARSDAVNEIHVALKMNGAGNDPRFRSLFGALWWLRCVEAVARGGGQYLSSVDAADLHESPARHLVTLLKGQKVCTLPPLSADLLHIKTEDYVIIGNLLRHSQIMPAIFGATNLRTLRASGWHARNEPTEPLGPYEIVVIG